MDEWQALHLCGPSDEFEFSVTRQDTESRYKCGSLTKALLEERCQREVAMEQAAQTQNLLQTVRFKCATSYPHYAHRTLRTALTTCCDCSRESRIFVVIALQEVRPDSAEVSNNVTVMAKLRERGYRVDEFYVAQNSSGEKFLY